MPYEFSLPRILIVIDLCDHVNEPVGRPKRDSTIVPHAGLSLATVMSSIPSVTFFHGKDQALREKLSRHGVWSAAVSLLVVLLGIMRQAFAL
jgi:hypothetical protein